MPEPEHAVATPKQETERTEQQLTVLLQKVIGQDNLNLTEEQITKVLDQRSTIASYVHEDRKRESFDGKFILVCILAFILIFSGVVLLVKPDVFSEVLSLVVGLVGGAGGGYGVGSRSK